MPGSEEGLKNKSVNHLLQLTLLIYIYNKIHHFKVQCLKSLSRTFTRDKVWDSYRSKPDVGKKPVTPKRE
jgi:hypothetical protein